MKKFIILISTFLLISLFIYLIIKPLPIYIKNVESITADNTLYTPKKDMKEIEKIISLYNSSKKTYTKGDTTPSHSIEIKLTSGKTIYIGVSNQGFHYVGKNDKQFKIKSNELKNYFK